MIRNAVIAGTGNVGTHLARALTEKGIRIVQLYNRTPDHGLELSSETGATVESDISKITADADLYIFSVNDSSLPSLSRAFPHKNSFVVHTSGSVPMSLFAGEYSKFGVFYPLQTFSEEVEMEYQGIPICIEADSTGSLEELENLALKVTGNCYKATSEQRARIHLAAVFACNFTNYMYTLADKIVSEAGISFPLLRPLIAETARKVLYELPKDVQTGPAARNDREIIEKHLSLLKDSEKHKEIYRVLSSGIRSMNFNEDEL